MDFRNLKINEVAYDEFVVVDSSGDIVTGLTNNDFTRDLYDPDGDEVSSTIIITISELGAGKYRLSFTPNKLGSWIITIYNNTHFPAGKSANYICVTNLNDDIPGSVWDVRLNDHTANNWTTGYKLKHVTGLGSTRIINKGLLTVEEKNQMMEDIKTINKSLTELKQRLVANTKANNEFEVRLNEKVSQVETNLIKSIYLLDKDIIQGEVISRVDTLIDLFNKEEPVDIDSVINLINDKFEALVKVLNRTIEDTSQIKQEGLTKLISIEEVLSLVKNDMLSQQEAKEILSGVNSNINELVKLFIKSLSTNQIETIMKEDGDDKSTN